MARVIDSGVPGAARLSARPRGLPRGSGRARSGGASDWCRLTRPGWRDGAAAPRRRARRVRTAHRARTDWNARASAAARSRSHRSDCCAMSARRKAARRDYDGCVSRDDFRAAAGRAALDRRRVWGVGATGGAGRQGRSRAEASGAGAADARPRVRPGRPATAGHAGTGFWSNGWRYDRCARFGPASQRLSGLSGAPAFRQPKLTRR